MRKRLCHNVRFVSTQYTHTTSPLHLSSPLLSSSPLLTCSPALLTSSSLLSSRLLPFLCSPPLCSSPLLISSFIHLSSPLLYSYHLISSPPLISSPLLSSPLLSSSTLLSTSPHMHTHLFHLFRRLGPLGPRLDVFWRLPDLTHMTHHASGLWGKKTLWLASAFRVFVLRLRSCVCALCVYVRERMPWVGGS